MDAKRLNLAQWGPLVEKASKKMDGWKGNLLSIGDRIILVNSCLSSIPLYMLSFLEAPKVFLKDIDSKRARMVWQETSDTRKYHLVNWPTVCMTKSCGGLSVLDLEIMNKCLLIKWLWKLENTERGCAKSSSPKSICPNNPCLAGTLARVAHTSGKA